MSEFHHDVSKVFKFVLTGGPCGGKTTALDRLTGYLKERGFRVFIAPEAATMLFLNGANFDDFKIPACGKAFQVHFLLIYICNFHVLSHLLLICICKLH